MCLYTEPMNWYYKSYIVGIARFGRSSAKHIVFSEVVIHQKTSFFFLRKCYNGIFIFNSISFYFRILLLVLSLFEYYQSTKPPPQKKNDEINGNPNSKYSMNSKIKKKLPKYS